MSWEFETAPEFAAELAWVDGFIRDEVEPVDQLVRDPRNVEDPVRRELIPPLQLIARQRGLWAPHVPAEDGGAGLSHVNVALLNEVIGRTRCGPVVFGCQAPDAGNLELLSRFATPTQKRRFLAPLMEGRAMSCFAVTEPQGGADPTTYATTAYLQGSTYVLNGEKWFASSARYAEFLIVMAITDPDRDRHDQMTLFLVPRDTTGLEILRDVHVAGENDGEHHSYIHFSDAAIPEDLVLGERGAAFKMMQTRMGAARLFIAMRTLGLLRQTLDMICERALSRRSRGETLADKQLVQAMIAESWMQIEQFRLLVLRTAWRFDRYGNTTEVRRDVAAVKALVGQVLHDVTARAIQIHGSVGVSEEMPLVSQLVESLVYSIGDGPTEVHKLTLAREILKGREATDDLFPTRHVPKLKAQAEMKFAEVLGLHGR